ncbi:MAG: PAS domain-containing sensor histidine kinase [Proteobacteria bacterium]|nr:MAG: PAS domain-containing sensor histidine kinase [Pseudomonadota bacterium]
MFPGILQKNVQKNLHKKILENLSSSVVLLNDNMEVVYLNLAAEMLLETSEKRLKGTSIQELFVDSKEVLVSIRESLHGDTPYTKREARLHLHSGNTISVDYTVTPFQDGNRAKLLVELLTRDRFIRISREDEMQARREASRIVVRGLAHEIKNPLGGIRGAAQLLDRALPDPSLQEYTRIIIEESDRLRNLVDRMPGPNNLVRLESINVHEILERVFNLVSVESRGLITLVKDYDPSIPEFEGDREKLIQAFLNIARNAMQALDSDTNASTNTNTNTNSTTDNTERSPPTIRIATRILRQFTLDQSRHRLVCQIKIIDNGPGIPHDMLHTLFYPMVSGRAGGTGLGLSITQSIIGQHGGLVECESEPGNTAFNIYIPLRRTNMRAN